MTSKSNGADVPARERILALLKPGAWLKKPEIAHALHTTSDNLTYHLGKLIADKALIAAGNCAARQFALPGTPPPKAVDAQGKRPAAPQAPRAPKRPAKKASTRLHKHMAHATPAANVQPFTAALTADKRMVLVGGSEPLIFSTEQTQHIADLVFSNFEAA